jgi:predicted component of type VI protein secretion system
MQVSLKVVGGKNDGRLINISVSEFVIGRGEEAHLRPASDLISRQHCVLRIEGGKVTIEDMQSRNGTFVNEQQLTEPYIARMGDVLRVGRLQFELLIDHLEPGIKRPKVNVAEAAARTATPKTDLTEESITDWLAEVPENPSQSTAMFETRHFNLDDTKYRIDGDENASSPISRVARPTDSIANVEEPKTEVSSGIFGLGKKKNVKKLPARQKENSANTTDAAGDVLRKFFNQR